MLTHAPQFRVSAPSTRIEHPAMRCNNCLAHAQARSHVDTKTVPSDVILFTTHGCSVFKKDTGNLASTLDR